MKVWGVSFVDLSALEQFIRPLRFSGEGHGNTVFIAVLIESVEFCHSFVIEDNEIPTTKINLPAM